MFKRGSMVFELPQEKRQEIINILKEVKADMDAKVQMGVRFDGDEAQFYNNVESYILLFQSKQYYDNHEISLFVVLAFTLWDTPYSDKADELTRIFLTLSQYIVSDQKATS